MEGTDMDMIEILKAVLEIVGGLALITLRNQGKHEKSQKNNRPQFPNLGGYFLII